MFCSSYSCRAKVAVHPHRPTVSCRLPLCCTTCFYAPRIICVDTQGLKEGQSVLTGRSVRLTVRGQRVYFLNYKRMWLPTSTASCVQSEESHRSSTRTTHCICTNTNSLMWRSAVIRLCTSAALRWEFTDSSCELHWLGRCGKVLSNAVNILSNSYPSMVFYNSAVIIL